jgi:hypothetical protein
MRKISFIIFVLGNYFVWLLMRGLRLYVVLVTGIHTQVVTLLQSQLTIGPSVLVYLDSLHLVIIEKVLVVDRVQLHLGVFNIVPILLQHTLVLRPSTVFDYFEFVIVLPRGNVLRGA